MPPRVGGVRRTAGLGSPGCKVDNTALYTNMSFRHVFLLEAVWRVRVRVATGLAHRFLIR